VEALRDDLASRNAPLEYWFIKLHAGDLAFLVDYIIRRASGRAEVRVSLWTGGRGRVARTYGDGRSSGADVFIGDDRFGPGRCQGSGPDVAWDLTYEVDPGRAAPTVPLLDGAFDMSLVSRPRTVFHGSVVVDGVRHEVVAAPGSVTHYWGRRLPERWHWISANGFAGTDLALEGVLLRTRLWGRRPALNAGYLWLSRDGRDRLLVSPLTGLMTVAGQRTDYTLTARGPRTTTRLRCWAPPEAYNDLGEGIRQTLLGRCAVLGTDDLDARAGLEYRA
jgi:hypothetical protein